MAINKSRTSSNIVDSASLLEGEKMLFDSLVETLDKYRKNLLLDLFAGKTPVKEVQKEMTHVKFLSQVPKFVGPELEVYGPFDANSETDLPPAIASVLINKGRAEEIKDS